MDREVGIYCCTSPLPGKRGDFCASPRCGGSGRVKELLDLEALHGATTEAGGGVSCEMRFGCSGGVGK